MVSIGLSKALNRKEIQTIGNPSTYLLRTKQGRINWELKNYSELEKILTRWQQAVFIMAQSQVFTEGLYYFFASRRNTRRTFDTARLNEIIMFIQYKYGNYLRKDINDLDLALIKNVMEEMKSGVLIDGNRIFPSLSYPFMDKQYFNHENWNRNPDGIAFISIPHNLDQYKIILLNSKNSTKNEEGGGCGCKSEKGTDRENSNENSRSNTTSCSNPISQINNFNRKIRIHPKLNGFKLFDKLPIIYIEYSDLNGHSGYYMITDCTCQIEGDTLSAFNCTGNGSGRGITCGKAPNNCQGPEACRNSAVDVGGGLF